MLSMGTTIFNALKTIIQAVNDASDLTEALNIVVQATRKALKADVVSVYYREIQSGELILMATDGLNANAIGKIRFPPNKGLVSLVMNQAEPINIADAHVHPNYCYVQETDEISFHGFLGIPIIHQRQTLGVLVVRHKQKKRFSSAQETFLITLAAQLAGAISYASQKGELSHWLSSVEGQSFSMQGLSGSPGYAIASAHIVIATANLDAVPDSNISNTQIESEIKSLEHAITQVELEYRQLSERMSDVLPKEELALFEVFILMLRSESLIDSIKNRIHAGQWAQAALRDTIAEHVKQFEQMEDAYFRERAVDIKDLGRRILLHLQMQQPSVNSISEPVILAGEEVYVSHLSDIPVHLLAGIVAMRGATSSHIAILARALGIPCIMGVDNLPLQRIKGETLLLDGYSGQLFIRPSHQIHQEYLQLIDADKKLNENLNKLINKPSHTLDDVHIPLYVNTGLLSDIGPSLKSGAEGVGLYRTEIPFLLHDGFPSEDEQVKIYQQVLKSFSPRPVTFRTLDIGGDKSLPYFPITEDNPFLGWRGIRIMLDHPEIFITQIRAILRANLTTSNLKLMLPMISDISEVDTTLELIRKSYDELSEDFKDLPYPEIGIMIEVPSAIYQIPAIAKRVDFFSIGSNDLTQYLLAVDRNNKQVADLYNSLHPSVLMAIKQIVDQAHQYNKPVSVCGEMAGDPVSALALLGLNVDSMSMSASSLLKVKSLIRSFSRQQANELSLQALKMESSQQIQKLFNDAIISAGHGDLVHNHNR